jgi:hypothetical protein
MAEVVRGLLRRPAPLLLAAILLTTACGTRWEGPGRADQFFGDGEHLGRTVTIRAVVRDVITVLRLEVDATRYGDASLLVVTDEPVDVQAGDVLRITGTVARYHATTGTADPLDQEVEPGEVDELEEFLHGATVEPVPA